MQFATLTLNPALDVNLQLDGPLTPDSVHGVAAETRRPGGKGINVARMLAAGGATVVAGGMVGEAESPLFDCAMREAGVIPAFVAVPCPTRSNLMITDGLHEYKLNRLGPSTGALPAGIASAALNRIAPAPDALIAGGSLPPGLPCDTYEALLSSAGTARCPVVLDTSGPALRALSASPTRFLKPNRLELETLLGAALGDEEAICGALRALAGEWGGIIFSDGPDGAWFALDGQILHAPSPDVTRVDTTAAGDMLLGQFCLDYFERRIPLPELAARAVAAGAAAVEHHGVVCPSPKRVEALAATVLGQVRVL